MNSEDKKTFIKLNDDLIKINEQLKKSKNYLDDLTKNFQEGIDSDYINLNNLNEINKNINNIIKNISEVYIKEINKKTI